MLLNTTLRDLEQRTKALRRPNQAVMDSARVDAAFDNSRPGDARLLNRIAARDIPMPFASFKQSGFGRDRSLHALHKYADLKAISSTLR